MLRAVLGLIFVAVACSSAVAEPKKKAGGAAQRNGLQNTERELVDALQTSSRNTKHKAQAAKRASPRHFFGTVNRFSQ